MNAAVPAESEQPAEPEQPVEPEQPAEPEQPVEPEQPSDEITVTVHDAGETYTLTLAKGDIRGEIEYIGMEGRLFAGWYLDSGFKTVTSLADITEDTEIHAKYVSDYYLRVRYTEDYFFRSRSVYLISAVEGWDFAETGFMVDGEAVRASGNNRRIWYSAYSLFDGGVGRAARLIVADYSIYGMAEGEELSVIPYWITADGTVVYGEKRVLTMGWYGIEG